LKIGNIDFADFSSVEFIINNKITKINCKNFEHKENKITVLPNEIALLRFLVNFYCDTLKNHIYVFENDMTVFNLEKIIDNFTFPNNITDLLIMHVSSLNNNIQYYNNLPYNLEYLRIVDLQENIILNNLPINLKKIFIYTAPYCELYKPYSHWPQLIKEEDIFKNIKIPFSCEISYNDINIK
jgi:hypothetical protein